MDIDGNLRAYLGDRQASARYASFDYCFNYFQAHRDGDRVADLASPAKMELSCLHLGYFLASWGMLRGSADLLQRSSMHYAPLVEVITAANPTVWEIDAHAYTDETLELVRETAAQIRGVLQSASDTLITKIMLGVFGCVPAFDTNFKHGFSVTTFGKKSLQKVARFYHDNADTIEAHRVPTLEFGSGVETTRKYTRAKVIDMIFFVEGGARL